MAVPDIRWMAIFADVPAADHDASLGYWSAVTGAPAGDPFGDRAEHHPLVPHDGDRYVWVQRIDEGDSRWHLDLYVPDPEPAAAIATALGARISAICEWWTACESPGGLPFCFVREDPDSRVRPAAASWPGGRSEVDQLSIDIPAARFDVEADFWSLLTGWARIRGDLTEFERLRVPANLPVRIMLQRLDGIDSGRVCARADLSADDRDAEVRRHVELGGRVEQIAEHWSVLLDPGGLIYCVTDRVPHV